MSPREVPHLKVQHLDAWHGLLPAVRSVTFAIEPGEIVGLVGANGAGKTTLLRSIAGAHRHRAGSIWFAGINVSNSAAHDRVARGIALVPEGRRLFVDMTVEENLKVGAAGRRSGDWNLERVTNALPQLQSLLKRRAGQLSGGQQQAVAIGRALMSNPLLLLLDEVSLGLSPKAVEGVYQSLASLKSVGVSIILVEQDLRRCMAFAERLLCMLEGRMVLDTPTGDTSRDEVLGYYFGTKRGAAEPAL